MKEPLPDNRARGFTLIELVITIVILGIISAVVMINFGAKAQHSVTAQADEFRRNLSHLQLLAISQGARLKLTVAPTSYSVCLAALTGTCDANSAIIDPATGARFSVPLVDGAQFTSIPGNGSYYFDTLGRPVQAATGSLLVEGTTIFNLNGVGRAAPVTVTVLPITGFAQTAYN